MPMRCILHAKKNALAQGLHSNPQGLHSELTGAAF